MSFVHVWQRVIKLELYQFTVDFKFRGSYRNLRSKLFAWLTTSVCEPPSVFTVGDESVPVFRAERKNVEVLRDSHKLPQHSARSLLYIA